MVISKPLYRLADSASYIFHPAILILVTVILFSSRFRTNKLLVVADVAILIVGMLPGFVYVYIKNSPGGFQPLSHDTERGAPDRVSIDFCRPLGIISHLYLDPSSLDHAPRHAY